MVDVHGLSDATQGLGSQVPALKIPLYQAIRRFTDSHGIGRSQSLDARTHIWNFTERQLFLSPLTPHRPHHDQTRMYPDPYSKLNTFVSLQLFIQVFDRSEDAQARAYCSVRIIFMGLGIAEVHEESIPEQLGDMSIVALDDLGTDPLVCTDHVTPVFGVELGGKFCGVHEITKHDRELTAFGFWERFCLSGWDGWCYF